LHPSLSGGEGLGRNYRSITGRVLTPFASSELGFCGNRNSCVFEGLAPESAASSSSFQGGVPSLGSRWG